jgi:hypothetical protein
MYDLKLHKNLNLEKWSCYSKGKQILMIANELNRAGNWIEKCQNFEVNQCYERAFELIDLTIEDNKWKNGLKELLRFREVLAALYIQENKDVTMNKKAYEVLLTLSSESYNILH